MKDKNIDSESKFRSLKPKLIENITLLNKNNILNNNNTLSKWTTSKEFSIDECLTQRNKKPSFWIEGYGCSANLSDMEIIAGQLKSNGFEIADNPSESSINLIVTCSVKDVTEHRMSYRIKKLSKENKPLVIAGCLPSADTKLVEKLNSKASLMGPNSISNTMEIVNYALAGKKSVSIQKSSFEKINLPKVRLNPVISIIQISTGCLSECTFCQTKLSKGNLQSFRIGNIINQIKNDIRGGSKEIWLTSTDNGCYGMDIGTNLVELLKKCIEIDEKDFMLRVGMMNPMYMRNIISDLIDIYSNSKKLFKFIHIPVQSGSERILRKMKRGHSAKTFNQIVKQFRERIPDITIATDIITGFPTETEDDFEMTLKMITDLQPDIVNSSKYSARPGTSASKLTRIDPEVITKRSEKLHSLIKDIAIKRNSRWLNWEGDVLIDEIDNGKLKGRNQYYKSIVIKEDDNKNANINAKGKDIEINNNGFHLNKGSYLVNSNNYHNNLSIGKTIKVKVIDYSNHVLEAVQIT
ncbi:MAG: tRNA (N(6)-L-threonylcarbamoyladenosine(37)-C(2))-methylthiotransferase [Candidatus Nitrosocosmicus sp.]